MSANDPRAHATTASGSSHLYVVPEPSTLNPAPEFGATTENVGWFADLLALYREGRIQPEPVVFPVVPLPATAAIVRDDFAFVYGLRLAGCDDGPVPYAASWAAARCGMGETTAWFALRKLVDTGVLLDKGELPKRGKGNGTRCYLPGVLR